MSELDHFVEFLKDTPFEYWDARLTGAGTAHENASIRALADVVQVYYFGHRVAKGRSPDTHGALKIARLSADDVKHAFFTIRNYRLGSVDVTKMDFLEGIIDE